MKMVISSFSHLRKGEWNPAVEMLNPAFLKKALWWNACYIGPKKKKKRESRTKKHFHYFDGINAYATPQWFQHIFLDTMVTVFLKSKMKQHFMALYWSFYHRLWWRCQNTISKALDISRSKKAINQVESNQKITFLFSRIGCYRDAQNYLLKSLRQLTQNNLLWTHSSFWRRLSFRKFSLSRAAEWA